jgi:hypothetical protein
MKANFAVLFALAAIVSVSSAFAGGETSQPKPVRAITWEEFRARCEHPESFDIQRAPQNISVQCTDVSTEYVPATPGNVPLASTRQVSTALKSDKFSVGDLQTKSVPSAVGAASCLRFKEVENTASVEYGLSCADVLSIKGSMEDYCVSSLDASLAKGAKITSRDTGRTIDTCGAVSAQASAK